jgi:hypothetical protein
MKHVEPREASASDLRPVAWSGAFAGIAFLVLAWLTTQVAAIRAAVPFTEDPYDAVVSFAVIGVGVVGGATFLRAIGEARRSGDPSVERRIAIGAAIATLIVAIAVASDIAAVLVLGMTSLDGPAFAALTLLTIAAVSTIVALRQVWHARAALLHPPGPESAEPDLIDDLLAIIGSVGARRVATGLGNWAERSRFSPRRHRVVVGFLGAAVAGAAAVVWHAFREGAWATPAAALVFGGLMAVGVGGAYLLCLVPLRLLRSVPRRPTGTG